MDFTIEQQVSAPPAAVQDALLDPGFIAARAEIPKLGEAAVVECTRTDVAARLRVRLRFTGVLSPAVTAVVDPEKLTWVDDGVFDLVALRAQHRIEPDHYADRLSCSYTSTLTADGTETRRVLSGALKVKMLLVGGRVEGAIVGGLRESAAAEAALLDSWLA